MNLNTTSRAGPHRAAVRPAWLGIGLLLAAPLALAVMPPPKAAGLTPQMRYQQDTARCAGMAQHDPRANCLSRASTRLARSQPTPTGESPDALMRNALKRCEPLPEPDRSDCQARMRGQGTVSGSVDGGGMLRELVTLEQAAPAAEPPTTRP